MDKKYELIPSDKEGLYRIKALKDFNDVKKGDIGGYVEGEKNLSQLGDCWIYDNARIYNNAVIRDDARVCDNARIWGDSKILNYGQVYGNAEVCGDAVVCNCANVYHNARVFGNAIIRDNAVVRGDARIFDYVIVCDNADVRGEVCICGDAMISSNKDYIIFKNWWSSGRFFTWTRSNNMWKVGCFYGTGEELIAKAYKDSEERGREYECIVKYVERILNTEECKTNKNIMKKKIQKPFNVEEAKNGARVERRDGKPVRIICYDRVDTAYPIIALIKSNNKENCFSYDINGKLTHHKYSNEDLVIIEEVDCPKFNVGDWVFMNTHGSQPWLVIKVTLNYYEIKDSSGYITTKSHHTIDSLFHHWTLKDAKPGNILATTDDCRPFIFKGIYYDGVPTAYCGIDTTDSIYISDEALPWTRDTVRPATYEERQILFNKLEEKSYKWDTDTLTLSKIQKRWRDNEYKTISGYYTHSDSRIIYSKDHNNTKENYNIFATEKQAKSALAMAQISQIMANDERFGGVVTDEEWTDKSWYSIIRINNDLRVVTRFCYELLAFHTKKQADLFLEENRDLVKDYYMID